MVGREEDALERQQDELTVLEAMYGGDDFELEDGKAVFLVRSAAASLTVRLPPLYPYEPPMLELSCPVASPAAVEAADQELTAIVRGDEEQECCVQLVQRFLELAAEELVEVQADAAAAAAATTQDEAGEAEEECVISIDHMNDSSAYMRLLERWAAEGGLAGTLLYDDSGRRVHGVVLVLQGGSRACTAFLHRLRTELVDSDAKGRRCRERQSTVLCRRPAGTHKADEKPAVRLTGWQATRYDSAAHRDELLDRMGMLHVGSGSERFGAANGKIRSHQ
tara:strand:- start:3353 stop:4189 length:837 start_codon:yes stop_codon:yes gene_type:complete